ncbi:MAG TPA: hypothetical protein VMB73_14885, partial [Acetobacteraceae bacterium]|nr:hypothetical protein [Acetobacteraceae bacterium]
LRWVMVLIFVSFGIQKSFSTPGAVTWSLSPDPIAWNLTGEFLYKDVVPLSVCIVLFLASLPNRMVPIRSN